MTDILLLFLLILINGVFAMWEIAVVSSRRARLVLMAETSGGARRALALAYFLSYCQRAAALHRLHW